MEKIYFLKKLGLKIKDIRTNKEISMSELARLSDKEPQSIDRVEKGKINPSIFYLKSIAQALEIPLKELFDFEEEDEI